MSDEGFKRRALKREGERPDDAAQAPVPGLTPEVDRDVWDAFARWRREDRRFALLSVVETRGFTPRKAGSHMLLDEHGVTAGTVGGGAIEAEALRLAAARLAGEAGGMVLTRHLTRELGMCCGGEMSVAVEVIEPRPRLFVYGGGYVARPLAAIADGCGFAVTVVDAREAWLTAERFPRATLALREPEDHARALETTARDYVLIATHDHALDQRIVQQMLPRELKFLGMIGSIPKQRKFALRLSAKGFSAERIARLRTPLGLSIGAQTPEEIAVSVVAELVAVRRGAEPERGWTPRDPKAIEDAEPAEGADAPPAVAGEEPARKGDRS